MRLAATLWPQQAEAAKLDKAIAVNKVDVALVGDARSTDVVVVSPKSGRWFGFVLGHVSSLT